MLSQKLRMMLHLIWLEGGESEQDFSNGITRDQAEEEMEKLGS